MFVDVAVTRHMGRTFVVFPVKRGVTSNRTKANEVIVDVSWQFDNLPVVLIELGGFSRAIYYGDLSLVNMVKRIPPSRLPWKKYSLN